MKFHCNVQKKNSSDYIQGERQKRGQKQKKTAQKENIFYVIGKLFFFCPHFLVISRIKWIKENNSINHFIYGFLPDQTQFNKIKKKENRVSNKVIIM